MWGVYVVTIHLRTSVCGKLGTSSMTEALGINTAACESPKGLFAHESAYPSTVKARNAVCQALEPGEFFRYIIL